MKQKKVSKALPGFLFILFTIKQIMTINTAFALIIEFISVFNGVFFFDDSRMVKVILSIKGVCGEKHWYVFIIMTSKQ